MCSVSAAVRSRRLELAQAAVDAHARAATRPCSAGRTRPTSTRARRKGTTDISWRIVSTAPLWLAATVVVPGATALLALSRRISPPVPTALALVLALGYTVSGSVALVLALAHVFSTAAFAIGLVAAVAALLTVALSSGRPPRPAWVRRPAEAELPALAAGGLGLAVVAFSALRVDPAVNLTSGGRWRYWADGREIAVLGHVPSSVHQWGASYPTTVSKVFLNAFTAGFSSLAGADVLPGYGALYLLGLVGTAAALWALAWELELRATSPLVPLLCAAFLHLHGVGVSERFAGIEGLYKAEWIGRMVAFTSLALAIRGLRRGERSSLLLGGGLLAVAAVTHGVPTLVVLLLGVAYLAAWSVAERRPRQAAVAVLTVALPATLVAGVVLLAAGGNLGFGGATSPYVEVNGADPTALFTGSGRGLRSGTFYLQPWLLAKRLAEAGLSTEPGTLVMVLLIVAVAAAAVLGLWRMPRDLAPLPATAALFGLLLWLVAVAFSARSHAYIPATFGQRRLFDFANLAVLLAVLPWLELAARRFAGHGRRTLVPALAAGGGGGRGRPPAAAGAGRQRRRTAGGGDERRPCERPLRSADPAQPPLQRGVRGAGGTRERARGDGAVPATDHALERADADPPGRAGAARRSRRARPAAARRDRLRGAAVGQERLGVAGQPPPGAGAGGGPAAGLRRPKRGHLPGRRRTTSWTAGARLRLPGAAGAHVSVRLRAGPAALAWPAAVVLSLALARLLSGPLPGLALTIAFLVTLVVPGLALGRLLRLGDAFDAVLLAAAAIPLGCAGWSAALMVGMIVHAPLWAVAAAGLVASCALLALLPGGSAPGLRELAGPAAAGAVLALLASRFESPLHGDALFHAGRVRKLLDLHELSLSGLSSVWHGSPHAGYVVPVLQAIDAIAAGAAGVEPSTAYPLLIPAAAALLPLAGYVLGRSGAGMLAGLAAAILLCSDAVLRGTLEAVQQPPAFAFFVLVPVTLALLLAASRAGFDSRTARVLLLAVASIAIVHATYAVVPLACIAAVVILTRRGWRLLAAAVTATAVIYAVIWAVALRGGAAGAAAAADPEQRLRHLGQPPVGRPGRLDA